MSKQRQISIKIIDLTASGKVNFETNQNHSFIKGSQLRGLDLNYGVVEVIAPFAYVAKCNTEVKGKNAKNKKKALRHDLANGFFLGVNEEKRVVKKKDVDPEREKGAVHMAKLKKQKEQASPEVPMSEKEAYSRLEKIAKHCHEANKKYCESIGDNSQPSWEDAPKWQKESAVEGVIFHLDNPEAKPSDSHESWLKQKEEDGWKYGEVKDAAKKTHPCMVPYDKLPKDQQEKDALFIATVKLHTEPQNTSPTPTPAEGEMDGSTTFPKGPVNKVKDLQHAENAKESKKHHTQGKESK